MASRAEVRQQRQVLDRLAELAGADLARAWAQVDLEADFEDMRPELLALMAALVERYGEAAAGVAADFYEDQRAQAAVRGRYTPPMAGVVTEAVYGALVGAVGVSLRGVVAGDPGMTLRDLAGALDLHVKGAYRNTIADAVAKDPAAGGWRREVSGGECEFCQGLAGQTFTGSADANFHAHCRCVTTPVWTAA